jgi:hypothetical protein
MTPEKRGAWIFDRLATFWHEARRAHDDVAAFAMCPANAADVVASREAVEAGMWITRDGEWPELPGVRSCWVLPFGPRLHIVSFVPGWSVAVFAQSGWRMLDMPEPPGAPE